MAEKKFSIFLDIQVPGWQLIVYGFINSNLIRGIPRQNIQKIGKM